MTKMRHIYNNDLVLPYSLSISFLNNGTTFLLFSFCAGVRHPYIARQHHRSIIIRDMNLHSRFEESIQSL